jgi:chemotaxis protein methyltransferase CheR
VISSPHGAGVAPNLEISDADFLLTARLIRDRFGIHLTDGKRAMVASRLYRAIRELGFESYHEFAVAMLTSPTQDTLSLLVDCISTNHTFFYREPEHFLLLRDEVLPSILAHQRQGRERDLRLWCAASSTGEEPYALAMVIHEVLGAEYGQWQAGLLATDISQGALQKAERAVYPTEAVASLPPAWQTRYFDPQPGGNSVIKAFLRKEVTFRRFNLMNATFPFKQPFHAIFCRNVMIYFEDDTRRALIDRMADALMPGGWFFVGHAETISGLTSRFRNVCPGVYRKEGR